MGERNKDNNKDDSTISRRESITKLGKYAALTAIGTFIILSPTRAQSASPPDPGGSPFD